MPAPDRRPLDFRTFDALAADVTRLRTHGYDQVGQWSLEQILDHLNKTMVSARDARNGLPRPARWALGLIAKRLLRTRSMPTVPAPKSTRPPAAVEDGAFERFSATAKASAALTTPRIDHPAFGWMSVEDWRQLQLIHAARHLSFLIPRV
ncbi:MAG: hypothetical protein JWM57_2513 [Phycisphaerales bacterium]|nr:hypothetical protein [Phycisphaerales bacterium]